MTLYLALGDTAAGSVPADTTALNLNDLANFLLLGDRVSLPGTTLPAGVNYAVIERAMHQSQQPQGPPGTVPMLFGGVVLGGSTVQALSGIISATANVQKLLDKLEQARRAWGPFGQGTRVMLWDRPTGTSDYTFRDVADGLWTPVYAGLPDGTPFLFAILRLDVRPYARTAPLADPASGTVPFGGLTGANISWFFRPGIPGDVDALGQITLTDNSSGGKIIQRVTLGRRTLRNMIATDFTPILGLSAAGIGASGADATAVNGTRVRATLTGGFSTLASVTSPSTGAAQHGLYDVWLRARDSAGVLQTPTTPTVIGLNSGGSLEDGWYGIQLAAYDANGALSYATQQVTANVPVLRDGIVTFFDDFSTGDSSRWTSNGGTGTTGVAPSTITFSFGAGYGYTGSNSLDPNTEYGFQAKIVTATSSAGGSFIYQTPEGGADTGRMRVRFQWTTAPTGSCIPFYVTSTNGLVATLVGHFQKSASGWDLYLNQVSIATSIKFPAQSSWGEFEVAVSTSAGNITVTVWVNATGHDSGGDGVQVGTSTWALPANTTHKFVLGAFGTAGSLTMQFQYTNARFSTGSAIGPTAGSLNISWPALSVGATGTFVYITSPNGGTSGYFDAGTSTNVTKTSYASITTGNAPAAASKRNGFSALRVRYGLNAASPVLRQERDVYTQIANSNWELVPVGTLQLPPEAPQEGQAIPAWYLEVQARSRSAESVTLDVDAIFLVPHAALESTVICEVPQGALSQQAIWRIDSNAEGRVSCTLLSKADGVTVIGQAVATGELTGGPGATVIVPIVETCQGGTQWLSDVNLQYGLQTTWRPRYVYHPGIAPSLLTVSGNEITDDARWRGTSGDGYVYPDKSTGIWPATTNLWTNGGFEQNASGITLGSNVSGLTRITTASRFGVASGQANIAAAAGNRYLQQSSLACTAATAFTVSWWEMAVSGSRTRLVEVIAHGNGTLASGAPTAGRTVGSWTQYSFTATAAQIGANTSLDIRIDDGGVGAVVYNLDGIQCEVGAVPTTYVDTSSGTATRGAARVQRPNTSLSAAQGWLAAAVRVEWPNGTTVGQATIFDWRTDANNRITGSYLGSSGNWQLERLAAGSGATATVAGGTFAASTVVVLVFAWIGSAVSVSLNGAAFTSVANSAAPSLPTSFDIGTVAGSSNFLQGEVKWLAAGTGTLTNADAATMNGFGGTAPDRTQFSVTSALSTLWRAITSQINEGV